MKKIMYLILLILFAMSMVICSGEKKQDVQENKIDGQVNQAELVSCPGCDMKMEKSKMVAHETNGETSYYCSEECRDFHLGQEKKKTDTAMEADEI